MKEICKNCAYWHSESIKCTNKRSPHYEVRVCEGCTCEYHVSCRNHKPDIPEITQKQLRTIMDQKKTIGSLRNTNKDQRQTIAQLRYSLGLTKDMKEELAHVKECRRMWKMMNIEIFKLIRETNNG